ncbi:MAG: Tim44-like domain-containing protein [Myxococcota bacterium]
MSRRFALLFWSVLLAVALPAASWARPGGGHSFSGSRSSGGSHSSGGGGFHSSGSSSWSRSGSSSSSSGSSSTSDGDPTAMLVLLVIIVVILVLWSKRRGQGATWSTLPIAPTRLPPARKRLDALRQFDPDFSMVLFEDFLYALYAKAQEMRGAKKLERLAAYLSEEAAGTLKGMSPAINKVDAIVIGSMYIDGVSGTSVAQPMTIVEVQFETNYTETASTGAAQSYYCLERWTLHRPTTAKSKPPGKLDLFGCPSCGAAQPEARDGNVCAYCGQIMDSGRFDWRVTAIQIQNRVTRGPQLGGDTPEMGTANRTVVSANLSTWMQALTTKDPSFSFQAMGERVKMIHREINKAWSARNWKGARPFVSDSLFQMQLYWMESYQKAGLRNITEGAQVTRLELADITCDRWFDAVTVRIYATGLDYTVKDSDGGVISGSKTKPRPFTEYWTLIRGSKVSRPPSAALQCPSCGAELSVNMAGTCEYCDAKITTGEFDWVLSRIEQDESYSG